MYVFSPRSGPLPFSHVCPCVCVQAVLEWEDKEAERQKNLTSIHGEGYKPPEEEMDDGAQFVVRAWGPHSRRFFY